ncbi:MerR family transcriptional regulator [Lactiplantibacillus paraplantarum]|uniref:MerR family transcriptional regulator n=1 Tax=Lactiplantibacillus paraplantarum TaxID=60520 RepID=UPI0023AAEA7C|nr:MerR family transcriptional regulator [Lactiplantibacillus paraplantarum]WEE35579.1 MerR family transcriptional regulator [Lactiplantibacillus paraplantarum]
MNTAAFCHHVHTTRDTLRYYEQIHLLVPKRTNNRYRQYDAADQQTFQLIRQLQRAGLTLTEIKQVLSLRQQSVTPSCHDETLHFIQHKASKFYHQATFFQQLASLADQLADALEHDESLKFQQLLSHLGGTDDQTNSC